MPSAPQQYGVWFTAKDLTRKAAVSAVKSIGKVATSYVTMGAATVAAGLAVRKSIKVIGQAVTAANDQSVANAKVVAALKQTGQWTQANEDMLFAYATELQNTLGIADDLTLSQNALALGMGATAESLPQISDALANITAAGLPAESILRGLTSALTTGDAAMLSRYIPSVRLLTKEQMMQGAATEMLLEQFGGLAAAQAGTFKGSVDILTAAYGDFLEQVGFVITESPVAKAAIQELTKALNAQGQAISDNTEAYVTLVDSGILLLIDVIPPLLKAFDLFELSLNAVKLAVDVFVASVVTQFQVLTEAVIGPIQLMGHTLDALGMSTEGTTAQLADMRANMGLMGHTARGMAADTAKGFARITGETQDSIDALEVHRQSILDSAAAMRDQYGPSLEEMTAGLGALGEAAVVAAEDVKKLDDALEETKLTIDDMLDSILALALIEEIAASSVGAMASLRIGTDAAAASLDEIIQKIEGVIDANMRMEQGLMTGGDAWAMWGERTKNVAFDVNNIVVNTLQRSINDTFSSMGNAAKASLGPIEDTGDAWKAAAGVVIDTLAEITASVVAAALAQGLANAVPIAGSAAAASGPAAPIVFAAVLATVGAAVAAAIGAAQSAESQIGAAEGGFVVGPGPRGVDSVNASLAPGEVVFPVDVVDAVRGILNGDREGRGGQGGGVTMVNQWSSFIPPTRLQFAREYDRVAVDATRRLKALGRDV